MRILNVDVSLIHVLTARPRGPAEADLAYISWNGIGVKLLQPLPGGGKLGFIVAFSRSLAGKGSRRDTPCVWLLADESNGVAARRNRREHVRVRKSEGGKQLLNRHASGSG